ncbi:hypothetical protein Q4603_08985 [Zobellia galactanivorans]|uniref:hypothetical protein n=1 Tax=Zobellia galactanivorans (strain DSM 12802 / CCUG 47099 / CIP 106680 / NCIMB 13871 / Dsij) TaxID=63186 RepID=UPI001C06BF5B|nr:hypothetical protein [Zobellia galactanivorans]MBU3024960.1 hypothetical protein [Zobellia galactanivorans]MDO6808744.1 hypothetical protein [Zobellia galactanivorans]
MIRRTSGKFAQNYEAKKYARPKSATDKPDKAADPSAEFRLLQASYLNELVEAAEYKVVTKKKKKLFWTVKEEVVVDNYKDFLKSKTSLVGALNDRAFLMFDDLQNFLKQKGIHITNSLTEEARQKFRTRDEYPILINYQTAKKLAEQLKHLNITDEDLRKADTDNLHQLNESLFEKQRSEVKMFEQAVNEIEKDAILLVRIRD